MNWMILIGCLGLAIIPCTTFYIITTNRTSNTKISEENMEEKKTDNLDIGIMKELDELELHVKNMGIPDLNKEKILKVISFEKDMIAYNIIKDLGTIEYKKLRESKK